MHNDHDSLPLTPAQALPGRSQAMIITPQHAVNGHALYGVPAGMEEALFAMGCFWGLSAYSGNSLVYIAPPLATAVA